MQTVLHLCINLFSTNHWILVTHEPTKFKIHWTSLLMLNKWSTALVITFEIGAFRRWFEFCVWIYMKWTKKVIASQESLLDVTCVFSVLTTNIPPLVWIVNRFLFSTQSHNVSWKAYCNLRGFGEINVNYNEPSCKYTLWMVTPRAYHLHLPLVTLLTALPVTATVLLHMSAYAWAYHIWTHALITDLF